ncbi:MAG: PAS domain S-box protein [Polyangia bacterium]
MRTRIKGYALAVGALVLAVLARWLLDPILGNSMPLVMAFGAVAASVWAGGYPVACVIAVAGYFACSYFFIPPRHTFNFATSADVVGMIAYLSTCSLIIAVGQAMRTAKARANQQSDTLRVTLASIGDAVITTDIRGRITYLNSVASALTGWTHAEAVGQPLQAVFQIVDEETRQPLPSPVTRALRPGAAAVGTVARAAVVARSGETHPIQEIVSAIRDDAGVVSGCVMSFRDVTAQRRDEQDKANQLLTARRLASIVECSDDAIIAKSLEGIIQTWNAGAEQVFGYTAAEAVGRHVSLVIPPERLPEEAHIIATLKAGRGISHLETERVRKDGRRILVSLTVSPIRDQAGRIVGASKIVRDVTRQRQTDERERVLLAQAAAASAKFQAFFDQGALFAGIAELDGRLLEANRLSWEGCGYTREQVAGKLFWEGPWWAPSPDLVQQIRTACRQAADGATFRGEVPYFVADGTQRVVDLTVLPIKDESGRVLFLAPTGIDITERKRAEAERKRLADDLRAVAADLSEANRRKTEFLAMLAHELRNPLAPISNAVRALRMGHGEEKVARAVLGMLERQVAQLGRLVDDLLDLSRVTRGEIALRKQPMELVPIIEQAVEATRARYGSLNQELTVKVPIHPLYLNGDPVRLTQVVGNLLNNACKFTDPGGHIALTVTHDDGQAIIRVRDDGIGISAPQLSHVFDMFTQLDSSLERTRDGLGIGLTLVKALAALHDGTVHARSDGPGRGSEFEVRLPVLTESPAALEPPPPAPLPAIGAHRILIVDDNVDGADSLAMLLQEIGHETHKAHDGVEALDVAERVRPDAVLLDIGLPKLNGYEVCRRMRERAWGSKLLIVALTGWGQEEDRQRSLAAGFDTHLVKPVDHELLIRLLASPPKSRDAAGREVAPTPTARTPRYV